MPGLACDIQARAAARDDAVEVIAAAGGGRLPGGLLAAPAAPAATRCAAHSPRWGGRGFRWRRRRETHLFPGCTTVCGGEVGAVGAHCDRMALPAAPHIEQRPLSLRSEVSALPVTSAIGTRHDDFIVADRDAMLGIEKAHTGEQCLGGHLVRLSPAGTAVVGEHDDAAITDRDQ